MLTKRNKKIFVQSRKVKKPKNFSRKLSLDGKAKKRGSSTRRRVQRGGDPIAFYAFLSGVGLLMLVFGGKLMFCAKPGRCGVKDDTSTPDVDEETSHLAASVPKMTMEQARRAGKSAFYMGLDRHLFSTADEAGDAYANWTA